ncbi:MAG: winged helix-turn-helix domain-containing protein [Cyanobacteriota bacterium]|nr:winged helix-turn-helix domain-containing protein [Cyanobacteriota bacterium]
MGASAKKVVYRLAKAPCHVNHWQIGPYLLSPDGVLRLGTQVISLSPLQRKLLLCFVARAGQLIERAQLFEQVWGHTKVSDVSLARAVHSLRQVFDGGPLGSAVISTSYGSGYVFSAPVSLIPAEKEQRRETTLTSPCPLALEYYFEARVASRHFDPQQLERSHDMLQRCLEKSPEFCEALLALVSVQLNRCRWGLLGSRAVGTEVERLLRRAEQLEAPTADLFALRAETISLVHWQPAQADGIFASWLPDQLGYGVPMLSWVRHLLACGRADEGLKLLEPQLDGALPTGWTLAAQLTFHLGQTKPAIEMLEGQLRIDGFLPSTHLFLAVLHAHAEDRAAALKSLSHCTQMGGPFQGFQAAVAYVFARVGQASRAEALLHQASACGREGHLGMACLWGLTAMVLGQRDLAGQFFQMAVQTRCYQAPFLAQSPLLVPYHHEPIVGTFLDQMAEMFPTVRQPSGDLVNTASPR